MSNNDGFTLIELMIVVAIVAILASVGLPSYQSYTRKAAMTDLIQALMPYKTAVELCAYELSNGKDRVLDSGCLQGNNGIPLNYQASQNAPGHTKSVSVAPKGIITLTGHKSLAGLTVTLTPAIENSGHVEWSKTCQSESDDLTMICNSIFKFNDSHKDP